MYAVLSPPAWGRELKYNDLRFETVREHCRPPRGGGNLNNIRALAEQPAAESPPTRGRELKCVMVHRLRRLRVEVAPHAGAGIEIRSWAAQTTGQPVAPHAGAGIEMQAAATGGMAQLSPPTRGRELK